MAATAKIFDASLQKEVDHTLAVDANGEIIATSAESGRVLKFQAGLSKAELEDQIKAHNDANEGQQPLSAEDVQKQEANTQASRDLLKEFGASDDEAQQVYRPEPEVDTTADAPNHQFDGADEKEHLADGVKLVKAEDRNDENPVPNDGDTPSADQVDRPATSPDKPEEATGEQKSADQAASGK